MIFLTTGTQLPFERLVRAVDEWVAATKPPCEVFGQTLTSPKSHYSPKNFATKERLTPTEYEDIFEKSSLIISHAGMGTILTALTQGKQICIMARLAQYGEHRNNHQLATLKKLKDYSGLFKAANEVELHLCINKALKCRNVASGASINTLAAKDFTDKLRRFIIDDN